MYSRHALTGRYSMIKDYPDKGQTAVQAEHEVTLFFVDGSKQRVSTSSVARNLLKRTNLKIGVLVVVLAALVSPSLVFAPTPLWFQPLVQIAKLALFAGFFLGALALAVRFWPAGRRLPELLLTVAATSLLTLVEALTGAALQGSLGGQHWLEILLRNALFFQLLTIMFFLFAYRSPEQPELGLSEDGQTSCDMTPSDGPKDEASAVLRIGTRSFDPSTIDLISVDDHLLRLSIAGRIEIVHGTLANALEHLDPQVGIQVHRASWVAFRVIDRIEFQEKRAVVVLKSGDVLAVSRNRRREVEAAFQDWQAQR